LKSESTYNEKELAVLIASGDNKAFDHLFYYYWDHVYSVALIMSKSPAMAEDIAQEVFLSLLENRTALATVENLKGYLYSHVKFNLLKRLRRLRVEEAYRQFLTFKLQTTNAPTPEGSLAAKELMDAIASGLEQLPPQQKRAFQLSRQQGYSHEEIGREMGISSKSVKDYIVRAIAFLKKYLAEQGFLAWFLSTAAFISLAGSLSLAATRGLAEVFKKIF
jgi:RNA polymerase sigma-70 factor (family 1)